MHMNPVRARCRRSSFATVIALTAFWCSGEQPRSQHDAGSFNQTSVGSSRPRHLAGGLTDVFLSASDGAAGVELWRWNSSGPALIANLGADQGGQILSSFPEELLRDPPVLGSRLYFAATDEAIGRELHRYDSGSTFSFDILAGASSDPRELTWVNGVVYFTARDNGGIRRLFRVDGDTAPAVGAAAALSHPYRLTAFGNDLYFAATDTTNATEMYRFDGTTVTALRDMPATRKYFDPGETATSAGGLYFSATVQGVRQLVRRDSNGTLSVVTSVGTHPHELVSGVTTIACTMRAGGTRQVFVVTAGNATQVTTFAPVDGATIDDLTGSLGSYWFTARDSGNTELWHISPGNVLSALPVLGGGDSFPRNLRGINGSVYFAAEGGPSSGVEPYFASATTITAIPEIGSGERDAFPGAAVAVGGQVAFGAGGPNGRELWFTDGSTNTEVDINTVTAATTELHIEQKDDLPNTITLTITAAPGAVSVPVIGLSQQIIPLGGFGIEGILMFLPLASGGSTISPMPDGVTDLDITLAPLPDPCPIQTPVLVQLATADGTRVQVSDPVSLMWGCATIQTPTGFARVDTLGTYDDHTGEYRVRVQRTGDAPDTLYVVRARKVHGTDEMILLDSRPIGPGEVYWDKGEIDLHLPLAPGDGVGDEIQHFFLPNPPVQGSLPASSSSQLCWRSYC
jgi:ELWxxDGT repeat protein